MAVSEQLGLGSFAPPLNPALSQWHTPQVVADRMSAWSVEPGMRVLEPCAGGGNIARALRGRGASVCAVEFDRAWCDAMRADSTLSGAEILCADFFALTPRRLGDFDLVVMNSPYEDGQDALWVERALEFAPRVVALVPSRILFGVSKHERIWSKHNLWRLANLVRRPAFAGNGGKFDVCVVDVGRSLSPRVPVQTEVEWWA